MAPQFDRPLRDLLRAAGCVLVRHGKGSHEIWQSRSYETSPYRSAFRVATRLTLSFVKPVCPRRFDFRFPRGSAMNCITIRRPTALIPS